MLQIAAEMWWSEGSTNVNASDDWQVNLFAHE
jgi:hypothetical protein